MSATEDTAPTGESVNAEAIAGLLAIAEWLGEHPEMPAMKVLVYGRADYTLASGTYATCENPREQMATFAESLDCRVVETVEASDVQLAGEVSPRVRVTLRTSVGSLGGQQRTPQYDYAPITETCSACGGKPVDPPSYWHHPFPPACAACNGTQTQLRAA